MITARQGPHSTDGLSELADDLRKVRSVVQIGAAMRDDLDRLDEQTFIAFCQLLDDRLSDIHDELEEVIAHMESSQGSDNPERTVNDGNQAES